MSTFGRNGRNFSKLLSWINLRGTVSKWGKCQLSTLFVSLIRHCDFAKSAARWPWSAIESRPDQRSKGLTSLVCVSSRSPVSLRTVRSEVTSTSWLWASCSWMKNRWPPQNSPAPSGYKPYMTTDWSFRSLRAFLEGHRNHQATFPEVNYRVNVFLDLQQIKLKSGGRQNAWV